MAESAGTGISWALEVPSGQFWKKGAFSVPAHSKRLNPKTETTFSCKETCGTKIVLSNYHFPMRLGQLKSFCCENRQEHLNAIMNNGNISCLLFKDDLILKICSNLKGDIFTFKKKLTMLLLLQNHRILDVFNSTTPKYQIYLQCCRKRGLCRRFDNLDESISQ